LYSSSCSRLPEKNINQKKGRSKKKKNSSNNIHGKRNLRVNKPFKREIDMKEKPKSTKSRIKRKVDMKGKH